MEMQVLGFHTTVALALMFVLLPPAPGDARQAAAQLRLEPAGCPSGYVLFTGGQCVQLKMARQYREGDQLDPRSTGFRPIRRRGKLWMGEWSWPGLAASNPEIRRVPARGVELEQRSEPVEMVRRPAGGVPRRRGHRRRGQHGRRGGRRMRERGGERRPGQDEQQAMEEETGPVEQQVTVAETSAAASLTTNEDDPATPAGSPCPPGRMGRRGRCRTGRRRGKSGGMSRDRAERRGRHRAGDEETRRRRPRPCPEGLVRFGSKDRCVRERGLPQEETSLSESDSTASTPHTPTQPAEVPDSAVQPGEAVDREEVVNRDEVTTESTGAPRRRQGQRRRGSRRRQGGRRRRPGGRPGRRREERPGEPSDDSGQPDSGPQDSEQPESGPQDKEPQPGRQPQEGRPEDKTPDSRTSDTPDRTPDGALDSQPPDSRRSDDRPPCPPGQVRWRRGRCVYADRLQACPNGSRRQPGGRCVRCEMRSLPETGRCPVGCAQTGDKCACCQPNRRHQPEN